MTHQWFLAVRNRQTADAGRCTPEGYQVLQQPVSEFRADPFPFEDGEDTWIFYECYPYREAKGHIAAGRLVQDSNGTFHLSGEREVLRRTYHLSYPCIFRANGHIWMIPETVEQRTVELYRCTSFPDRWELHQTLLQEVDAADATLIFHDGLWWMFTAELAPSRHERFLHKLHLFVAREMLGPFSPHPQSPLRCSTTGTRSAGNTFVEHAPGREPRLLWPTQDCTKLYGAGIEFREIVELTSTNFADRASGTLYPSRGTEAWDGLHTYQRTSRFEVVDGLRFVWRPKLKLLGLVAKMRRSAARYWRTRSS